MADDHLVLSLKQTNRGPWGWNTLIISIVNYSMLRPSCAITKKFSIQQHKYQKFANIIT